MLHGQGNVKIDRVHEMGVRTVGARPILGRKAVSLAVLSQL